MAPGRGRDATSALVALVAAVGRGGGQFSEGETETLSTVCVRELRALATDSLPSSADKIKSLSLIAELTTDPSCSRAVFNAGAIPQMLLAIHACSHTPEPRFEVPGAAPTARDRDRGAEVSGGSPPICRCVVALQVLTKLVQGLPQEASSMVVRNEGLGFLVQMLSSSDGEGGKGVSLPTRRVLELFAAISESPSVEVLKWLGAAPGLLGAIGALTSIAHKGKNGHDDPASGDSATDEDRVAEKSRACKGLGTARVGGVLVSAFHLLANLASLDDSQRRKILAVPGIVSSAAAAVTRAAVACTHPCEGTLRLGQGGQDSREGKGQNLAREKDGGGLEEEAYGGEEAARLLHCLAAVLGSEGCEADLIAAGSAAVAGATAGAESLATEMETAGPGAGAGAGATGSRGIAFMETGREAHPPQALVSESLSCLAVMSWSSSGSLDAAAALDGLLTDPSLSRALTGILWPRGGGGDDKAQGSWGGVEVTQMKYTAIELLLSIAHRPVGRASIVAAGAVQEVLSSLCTPSGSGLLSPSHAGEGVGAERSGSRGSREGGGLVGDWARPELLKLLRILSSSLHHRDVVRGALLSTASVGGSLAQPHWGLEEEAEKIKTLVERLAEPDEGAGLEQRTAGPSSLRWRCRMEADHLALLLGLGRPPMRRRAVLQNEHNSILLTNPSLDPFQ
ncbi:unnamed protein product, partial [Discosporangium mesarthrocarpum]